MKHVFRTLTALSALVLSIWYFSPQVYGVLHLPDVVDQNAVLSAPAIVSYSQNARFVRESGDERLTDTANQTVTVSLFGILPLKTVTVSSGAKTVNLGGEAVGVILRTEGVQVVGFERIETAGGAVCPAISAGLREGDMICAVNGEPVSDGKSLSDLCGASGGKCTLSCIRDGERFSVQAELKPDESGVLRLGVWVRDSTSGIGTLSFYDANTLAYAALGHGVTDVDTQKLIAPATGFLFN